MHRPLLVSDLAQTRAGGIENVTTLVNRRCYGADNSAALFNQDGNGRQMRRTVVNPQQLAAQVPPRHDGRLDGEQVVGGQDKPAHGVVGRPPDISRAANRHGTIRLNERRGLARFSLPLSRLLQVGCRQDGHRKIMAAAETRVSGYQLADLVEFQNRKRLLIDHKFLM